MKKIVFISDGGFNVFGSIPNINRLWLGWGGMGCLDINEKRILLKKKYTIRCHRNVNNLSPCKLNLLKSQAYIYIYIYIYIYSLPHPTNKTHPRAPLLREAIIYWEIITGGVRISWESLLTVATDKGKETA